MSPVNRLLSVARATVALRPLIVLLVAVSISPNFAHARDKKPVAAKDVDRAVAGEWTTIEVLSNDYDPEGTKVRVKRVKQPKQGQVRIKKKKKLQYKPDQSARGRDVIRYIIRDRNGKGKKAKGKVVMNVDNPAAPFTDLCGGSGVIFCEGFEDLSGADFNNRTTGHAIASDDEVYFEGGGALRLTVDGSREQEITGTIGYDFPKVTSGKFYVSVRMHFGDGLQSLIQSQAFGTGAGMKFFQLVAGPRSCSSEEIVLADSAINSYLTGLPQLVHSCSGYPFRTGTDWQPVTGDLDDCGYTYIINQRASSQPLDNPNCVLWADDVWHLMELEVDIGNRLRLWVDGRLTVDQTETSFGTTPSGPYGRIYLSNYMTGYGLWGHQMAGDGTFGNGLWRIRYDNLIISTECITSCGQ